MGSQPNGSTYSSTNGHGHQTNNESARQRAFKEFHKRTGVKPFSPDFIDSMVAIMRDPDSCLSERVTVWAKWRAWGNSSEYAVGHWDPEKTRRPFDQTDCALDLAWFEEGRPLAFVERAPEDYRAKARQPAAPERPAGVIHKTIMSRAFAKAETRGTLSSDGRKVIPPVSPPENRQPKLLDPATFKDSNQFLTWFKVADPDNFQKWQEAKTRYFEARKVARIRYREWRKPATSEAAISIDVMPLKANEEININGDGQVGRSVVLAATAPELETDRPTDRPPSTIDNSPTPEPGPPPPAEPPAPEPTAERLAEIQAAIPAALCKKLIDTPTVKLIKEIDRILAGAPVAYFAERIRQRYDTITSLGFLRKLAADAAAAWRRTSAAPPGDLVEPEKPKTPAELRREKEDAYFEEQMKNLRTKEAANGTN